MLHAAINEHFIQPAHDAVFEPVSQTGEPLHLDWHVFMGHGACLAQTNDSGNVESAGTHAALVAAAVNDGGNLHARILATNVESPDTFRSIHLVPADGHDIDVHL